MFTLSVLLPECFVEALSDSIEVGTIDLGSNLEVVTLYWVLARASSASRKSKIILLMVLLILK